MWLSFLRKTRPVSLRRPARPTYRPRLMAFEDRCLLSGGVLNPGFGSGGIDSNIPTASIAVQSNGDIVSAGTAGGYEQEYMVITRVTPTGALDTTFNGSGTVHLSLKGTYGTYANTVLIQPDGKILVGGEANTIKSSGGDQEFLVARLSANGTLDKTFGRSGLFTWNPDSGRDDVRGLALQSNGNILATGNTHLTSGDSYALLRLTPSGALDTAFGNQGNGLAAVHVASNNNTADSPQSSIVQAPNGDSLLCGSDSAGNADLVAFTSSGKLDASYGGNGYIQYAAPAGYSAYGFVSMVLQGNNLIMVGTVSTAGPFAPTGDWYGLVSRYTVGGTLDTTFATNGYYIASFPGVFNTVTLAADGSIFLAGTENYQTGVDQNGNPVYAAEMVVGHFSADGQADTTFGSGGSGFVTIPAVPNGVGSMALIGNDLVLAGGSTLAEVTAS